MLRFILSAVISSTGVDKHSTWNFGPIASFHIGRLLSTWGGGTCGFVVWRHGLLSSEGGEQRSKIRKRILQKSTMARKTRYAERVTSSREREQSTYARYLA